MLGREHRNGRIDINAWKDLMGTVRTDIEDRWKINTEDNFERAKSRAHNPVCIDSVDIKPTIRLLHSFGLIEGVHVTSCEKILRRIVAVVVVIKKIGTLAEKWIDAAVGPDQKNPLRSAE